MGEKLASAVSIAIPKERSDDQDRPNCGKHKRYRPIASHHHSPSDESEREPNELERHGFLQRYEIDGLRCIQIPTFKEHQSPHYSEKPSVIKPPKLPENVAHTSAENSGNIPGNGGSLSPVDNPLNPECGILTADSPNPEKRNTPLRKANGHAKEHPAFEAFWAVYPHFPQRSSKAESFKRWQSMRLDPLAGDVMRALQSCLAIPAWTKDSRAFVSAAEVWLRKKLWEQEPQTMNDALLESILADPRCQ